MFTWLPRHIQVVLPGNLDVDLESLVVVLQRLLVLALYPLHFAKVVEGRRHRTQAATGRRHRLLKDAATSGMLVGGLDLEGFLAVLPTLSRTILGACKLFIAKLLFKSLLLTQLRTPQMLRAFSKSNSVHMLCVEVSFCLFTRELTCLQTVERF